MRRAKRIASILAIAAIIFIVGMPLLILYEMAMFFTLLLDKLVEAW